MAEAPAVFDPDAVELVPVAKLTAHPRNPRRHLRAQAVRESLDEHGQFKPLVVQRSTGYVLAGNGTLAQLQAAGAEVVGVLWLDVDDDQAERIMLVDNYTSDHGQYDTAALAELLADHEAAPGIGWTPEEAVDLAALLAGGLSMDDLELVHDDPIDPKAFWPVARIPLPRAIYDEWIKLTAEHDGDGALALEWLLKEVGRL